MTSLRLINRAELRQNLNDCFWRLWWLQMIIALKIPMQEFIVECLWWNAFFEFFKERYVIYEELESFNFISFFQV